jgi:HAD superfamily hydrolase (TIGR01549 family)
MSIAVGFDFDHTLGTDNHLERRAFGVLAAELGTPIDIAAENERTIIERLLVPFRRATLSMADMLVSFVTTLPPRAQSHGHSGEELEARYRAACFGLVDELVRPLDGARACIDALVADGIPVGILTNGWSPLQERKIARALGPFPGPVLVSETIGAYKPSRDAFAQLERALGCTAADLWYVGDNPLVDIDGARAYGVRGVWFDWEGVTFPADLPPPAARIGSLADLTSLIRGS